MRGYEIILDCTVFQVLLLEASQVPPLLRDVVSAPELINILGHTPVSDGSTVQVKFLCRRALKPQ